MTTSRNGQIIDADRRSARVDTPTGRKWVRWTRRMKAEFLDELAATCNVAASAAAIGVSATSVYALRRRDDAFADAWQEALAQGYQMLETQLVGHALTGGGAGEGQRLATGDPDRPGLDVELALKLLNDHRGQALRGRPVGGPRPKVASRAETNVAIMKKLKAIEGRLGLVPWPDLPPSPDASADRNIDPKTNIVAECPQ